MKPEQLRSLIWSARAVSPEEQPFFDPLPDDPLSLFRSPDEIPDLIAGVGHLVGAIRSGGRVGIFGDYDADGITSTAILARWLRAQGVDVECQLATRTGGYGFNRHAARELSRCDLVVVFDCGTSDEIACQVVRDAGTVLIVVDHHTVPRDPARHPADALINPKRLDHPWPAENPFTGLCSAALSWILCWRAAHALGQSAPMDLIWLAALGSVADRAPLRWESRLLVRLGIHEMNRNCPPVIRAILREANRSGPITETHLGWTIGPRLNAPGRMGDPRPALDALLARSPLSVELAVEELGRVNARRQEAQKSAETDISAAGVVENPACVIAIGSWTSGISGIIAARVADEHERSAFALSGSDHSRAATGSARGYGGQSVYSALAHVDRVSPGTLLRWGGHAAAAGFVVAPGQVDTFCRALESWRPESIQMVSRSDMTWSPRLMRARGLFLAHTIDRLAPYGQNFARPVITIPGATIQSRRAFGPDRVHLKLYLRSGAQIIMWNGAHANKDLQRKLVIDVTGEVGVDEWAGKRFVKISRPVITRRDH